MKKLWQRIFGRHVSEKVYVIDKRLRAEFELWGDNAIKVYIVKMSDDNGIPDDEIVEQFVIGKNDNLILDWKIDVSNQELNKIYSKLK